MRPSEEEENDKLVIHGMGKKKDGARIILWGFFQICLKM